MNGWALWLTVLACGVVTLLIRASFVVLPPGVQLPRWASNALMFVGAAVLPALVVPAVLFQDLAAGQSVNTLRIIAALLATAIAVVTKNVFATLGTGMAALWLLKWMAAL
ncbi:MAG: AzlD domain-containing protein [Betaproteobacteria bacterium]|nr:AzlD domain-containing protein [Betaproteobacteria bacterium]